jgi:dipeptidyl aminopeptidase/acylaminoacyl peptidase
MFSRQIVRAAGVRARIFAILFAAASVQSQAGAQAMEPASLKAVLAEVQAMPLAPALSEEDLSRRSRLRDVKLSPDGRFVAYLDLDGPSASLFLLDVESGARRKLAGGLGRGEVQWSDNDSLFLDSGDALSAMSLKDAGLHPVVAFDRKRGQRFLGVDLPRHAALTEEFDRAEQRYRLLRVDADGKRTLLYEGGRRLRDYLLDDGGKLAFTVAQDENYVQIVSRLQDGAWVEVSRCKRRRACTLVAASPDGSRLTMLSEYGDDRRQLVELDLANRQTRILHTDPLGLSDLRNVGVSPESGKPLFAWYDMPYRRNYGLTPEAAVAASDIARAFPASNITIGASEAAPRWLLTERGARLNAERYWLYERRTHAFSQILRQERAASTAIPEQQLARKIALHYRASDGMLVHGYLSLPPGRDPARLPMLTMVHGGPWSEFDSGYSTLVQLLVNRGVAVFQPNFRASTGYGARYMLAPKDDFGNGRVQADIVEGVRWLLAQGVGDRRRLAIMGDSFGGYSTLLALTHTPELFRFGMATVPPSDFASTMTLAANAGATQDSGEMPFALVLREMGIDMANPEVLEKMRRGAPAAHPEKIAAPLLILAGARDDKVDIAGVMQYAARLQALGKPVSLLVDPDEGHNPKKAIVRQAYVYLLGQLLHQHLGVTAPAAATPELTKYLEQSMKMRGALK